MRRRFETTIQLRCLSRQAPVDQPLQKTIIMTKFQGFTSFRKSALRLTGMAFAMGALAGQAWAADATNGQTLYNATYAGNTCAGCHGVAPTGTLNKIQNGISAQAIKNACLASKMPCPTPALTDSQYNDLALYIATARGNAAAATCIGGSCAPAGPAVSLSSTSLSFGSTKPAAPVTQQLTLTNSGTVALNITTVALGAASPFSIVAGAGTTCTNGSTVAPAATCTVTVQFDPSVAGTVFTDTLTFTTDATPTTSTVALSFGVTAPAAGANSGGGGCTIGQADQPLDPLWLLLLGGAGLALFQRRRPVAAVKR
jgi:hypothetical protein